MTSRFQKLNSCLYQHAVLLIFIYLHLCKQTCTFTSEEHFKNNLARVVNSIRKSKSQVFVHLPHMEVMQMNLKPSNWEGKGNDIYQNDNAGIGKDMETAFERQINNHQRYKLNRPPRSRRPNLFMIPTPHMLETKNQEVISNPNVFLNPNSFLNADTFEQKPGIFATDRTAEFKKGKQTHLLGDMMSANVRGDRIKQKTPTERNSLEESHVTPILLENNLFFKEELQNDNSEKSLASTEIAIKKRADLDPTLLSPGTFYRKYFLPKPLPAKPLGKVISSEKETLVYEWDRSGKLKKSPVEKLMNEIKVRRESGKDDNSEFHHHTEMDMKKGVRKKMRADLDSTLLFPAAFYKKYFLPKSLPVSPEDKRYREQKNSISNVNQQNPYSVDTVTNSESEPFDYLYRRNNPIKESITRLLPDKKAQRQNVSLSNLNSKFGVSETSKTLDSSLPPFRKVVSSRKQTLMYEWDRDRKFYNSSIEKLMKELKIRRDNDEDSNSEFHPHNEMEIDHENGNHSELLEHPEETKNYLIINNNFAPAEINVGGETLAKNQTDSNNDSKSNESLLLNWSTQTNVSEDIKIIENYESNKKDFIKVQILGEITVPADVEQLPKTSTENPLIKIDQYRQAQTSTGAVLFILMGLVFLTIVIILISCAAFTVTKKMRKSLKKKNFRPKFLNRSFCNVPHFPSDFGRDKGMENNPTKSEKENGSSPGNNYFKEDGAPVEKCSDSANRFCLTESETEDDASKKQDAENPEKFMHVKESDDSCKKASVVSLGSEWDFFLKNVKLRASAENSSRTCMSKTAEKSLPGATVKIYTASANIFDLTEQDIKDDNRKEHDVENKENYTKSRGDKMFGRAKESDDIHKKESITTVMSEWNFFLKDVRSRAAPNRDCRIFNTAEKSY